MLHDADLAEAILDRVLERGRVLHFKGPSYRTRHLRAQSVPIVSGKEAAEFQERTKEELAHAYFDKDEVEKGWRVGKGALGLTGVKHYKWDRVVAHLMVCHVAYLLWVAVRRRLREAQIPLSPEKR